MEKLKSNIAFCDFLVLFLFFHKKAEKVKKGFSDVLHKTPKGNTKTFDTVRRVI